MAVGEFSLPAGGSSGPDCCFYERTTGYSFYGGVSIDDAANYWGSSSTYRFPDMTQYYCGFEITNFMETGQSDVSFTQMRAAASLMTFRGADGKWYSGSVSTNFLGRTGGTTSRMGAIGSNTNWTNVSCSIGSSQSLYGINSSGELYVHGSNGNGHLGIGSTTNISTNVIQKVTTLAGDNWTMVSGGNDFAVGIHNGSLYTCGSNSGYRTGQNTTSGNTISWTKPYNLMTGATDVKTDWVYCEAGNEGFMAIDSSGALWGAGNNNSGRFGTGNTNTQVGVFRVVTSGVSKIFLAGNYSFYINTSGTLFHSGNGSNGIASSTTTTYSNKHSGTWDYLVTYQSNDSNNYGAIAGKQTNGNWYYWGRNDAAGSFRLGRWMPPSAARDATVSTPTLWPNSPTSIGFPSSTAAAIVLCVKYP
jgi:alpha-tubulin suppressor-like RCC1 family protein